MPPTPGGLVAWAAVATLTSVTLLAERGLVRPPACRHPGLEEAPADLRSLEVAAPAAAVEETAVVEAIKVALPCVEAKEEAKEEAKDVQQVPKVEPEAVVVQQVPDVKVEPEAVVVQDIPAERAAEVVEEDGGPEPVAWDARLLGGVLGASLAIDLVVFPLAIYVARLCWRRSPRSGAGGSKGAPPAAPATGGAEEDVAREPSAARKKGSTAASARRRHGGPPADSSAAVAPEATPEAWRLEEPLNKVAEEGDATPTVEADGLEGDDEEATPTRTAGDDGAASEVPPSEPPSLPCEDSGDVDGGGAGQVRPVRRGKLDLAEVMERQRASCEEWGSEPRCGVRTDAVAEQKKEFSALPGSRAAREAERAKDAAAAAHALEKRPARTPEEFRKLMEARRSQSVITTVVP